MFLRWQSRSHARVSATARRGARVEHAPRPPQVAAGRSPTSLSRNRRSWKSFENCARASRDDPRDMLSGRHCQRFRVSAARNSAQREQICVGIQKWGKGGGGGRPRPLGAVPHSIRNTRVPNATNKNKSKFPKKTKFAARCVEQPVNHVNRELGRRRRQRAAFGGRAARPHGLRVPRTAGLAQSKRGQRSRCAPLQVPVQPARELEKCLVLVRVAAVLRGS